MMRQPATRFIQTKRDHLRSCSPPANVRPHGIWISGKSLEIDGAAIFDVNRFGANYRSEQRAISPAAALTRNRIRHSVGLQIASS